jgi:hypothetical protein
MALIREQARKLYRLSETMESWTKSNYNPILRIVNTDTLIELRKCWSAYITHCYPPTNRETFEVYKQVREVLHVKTEGDPQYYNLTKSFGALTNNSLAYATFHSREYWGTGVAAQRPGQNHVNPLLLHSSRALEAAIRPPSNPMTGFHLASPLAPLAMDSPFIHCVGDVPPTIPGQLPFRPATTGFPTWEFGSWCIHFNEVARDSTRAKNLRLRFFVGDATAFCFGLARLKNLTIPSPMESYADPNSGEPLKLDGGDYLLNGSESAPLTFNVVDASTLPSSIGLINIFVSIIPLLEFAPSTVLFTETHTILPEEQLTLLENMLLGDVGMICTLFGIAPLTYMTGTSLKGYQHDTGVAQIGMPVSAHIVWKFTTSGDPAAEISQATPSYDGKEFAELLYKIYVNMFPFETEHYMRQLAAKYIQTLQLSHPDGSDFRVGPPMYTRCSFAAFLAFLKSRVSVDWNTVIHHLTEKVPISTFRESINGSPRGWKRVEIIGIFPSSPANQIPTI